MELRVAIRVSDDRDHKHLSTTMRLANQRDSPVRLIESSLSEADVVILRRGDAGTAPLLRACEEANHPIPVLYATSLNETNAWVLRWPARTTDLIPLAEALFMRLQATREDATNPALPAARNHR